MLGPIIYYQRHTLNNYYRCVKSQSFRLIHAYMTYDGIKPHNKILTTIGSAFRIIYVVDYNETEVSSYTVSSK